MTVQPNPVLRKLGLADTDRVVIIHVDDLGAYQSALPAFAELMDFGLISSAAVMTPCPWFPAVAAFCREHPQADIGVHATLNSEWTVCRWGPVSTREAATGLLDDEGYFHQWQPATYACADAAAVGVELEAQVEMARKAGINLTHVDTHMGTSTHAKFRLYHIQTALKYGLPPMIVLRGDEAIYRRRGFDKDEARAAVKFAEELEDQGIPLLDYVVGMPLDHSEDRVEVAKAIFDALPVGIGHLYLHPAQDTPELRALCSDWQCRVADYQAFLSPALRDHIRDQGIQVIGYRALKDLMPA